MWFAIEKFWRKLRLRLKHEQAGREVAEEIEFHTSMRLREHRLAGLPQELARFQTNREMGNITVAVEQSADIRTFLLLEHLMQDIRYALRLFRKSPGFTLVAVLSLALGIAGNTAVFSMVNGLLIRPLPFTQPDRLVRITEFYPKALLVHFQQTSRTMDLAAVSPGVDLNVTGRGPAFRITASAASANLFSVLGAGVQRGRIFEAGEDHPGRDHIAILSHQLWTSQFNSDPEVIGRVITVSGIDRRIVGIMPEAFVFPSTRVQMWFPATLDPSNVDDYWGGEFVPVIGRLRTGATREQAQQEVHAIAANVWSLFPFPMPRHFNANATVISLQTDLAGDTRGRLLMLLCAVGAVLAIACANVASLLLARATTRRREIALRAALGAGRLRVIRQLITESLVLSTVAGSAGLLLGAFTLRLFRTVISPDLAGIASIGMDWNVALFAASLSLITGVAFGVVPAWSAARLNLVDAVKTGSQRSTTGAWLHLRSCLIAAEIALTVVLVIGASLLVKSLYGLSNVNPGFNPQSIASIQISPDSSFCADPSACVAFYDRMLHDARGLSNVTDAALANTLPLDGSLPALAVDVEGHPKTPDFPAPMLWAGAVAPGYLRVMQIPLVAGRLLSTSDTSHSEPVILITASTAKRFWPNENAVGKHIKTTWETRWRTVVGVVADVRQHNLADRTPASLSGAMYMPYSQSVEADHHIPSVMNLIVRTAGNAALTDDELHRLARTANLNVPVGGVIHLKEMVGDSISNFRSTTWLFLAFAIVALVLATIGIYGLVSYSVTQRTYEISLRMAIGASSKSVVRMILAQSLRITCFGTLAGLVVAFAGSRLLAGLLFNVAPTDPVVYTGVSAFLLVVAAAASSVPAWRASQIDPIRSLRAE